MTKLTIMRTAEPFPDEQGMSGASKLLFGSLDGMCEASKKAWRKFWKNVTRMEPGELANIEVSIPRNPKFHRKFFALLNVGFEAWEPGRKHKTYKGKPVAKNFDVFREEVTILAGYYEQSFDLKGNMKLRAKSIRFGSMEEPEFEQLYSAVADVLLEHVLTKYANRAELDRVVQEVLGFV